MKALKKWRQRSKCQTVQIHV